ncbi:MAG: TonB-dependent receptor plug domain-containing protein, partial [Dechloromonas sp.]
MKHPTPVIFRMRRACCFTALLLGAGPFLNAQSTPASVDEGTETTKEVVVLNPFLVTQEDEGGYGISQSALGTRTVQPILNLPSSVAAINREFLDDLNAATMADALNFGVSGVTNSTINSDDVNIRGFRANQALRDGVMVVNFKRNPMYDVDRIEVIKGPQSATYGRSTFGGAINYITKKPGDVFEANAGTDIGSDGQLMLKGTVSGPLSDTLDAGVTAMHWNHDGFYTNSYTGERTGGKDGTGVAGTLVWKATDTLKLTGRLENLNDHFDVTPYVMIRFPTGQVPNPAKPQFNYN